MCVLQIYIHTRFIRPRFARPRIFPHIQKYVVKVLGRQGFSYHIITLNLYDQYHLKHLHIFTIVNLTIAIVIITITILFSSSS